MNISDLKFTNSGCCGTHNWAEYFQEDGIRVQIYNNDDGTFNLVKFSGNLLLSNSDGLTKEKLQSLI